MKKYHLKKSYLPVYAVALTAFLSFSCHEDFNPQGPYRERYILNCILRADTASQFVFISKNFSVEEYTQNSYSADEELRNADIRIWHKDSVLLFKPAVLNVPRNSNSIVFTKNGFTPMAGAAVEVEAVLSNGRKLKAAAKVPEMISVDFSRTDTVVPAPGRNNFLAAWIEREMDVYYAARFSVVYLKKVNGQDKLCRKYIPLYYDKKDGKDVPVFSSPSKTPAASCETAMLDRAMREISEGDINKENYKINAMLVEVLVLDRNIGSYYSASNLLEEGFTVKVDQADYTNVRGGYGVFGAYIKKVFSILIDSKFIRSFGYQPGIPDKM